MSKEMHHLIIGDDEFEIVDQAARTGIGSPLVAATAVSMTDTSKIYVYTGTESGYETGHWYYFNGTAWADGGLYQSRGITPNSVTGAKLSSVIKSTLLNLVQHVAFVDGNGESYYTSLYNALYDVAVESISALFAPGSAVIYDTDSLNDLKQYLTVTAQFEDGTSTTVADYELSGTLTIGTSTITVTYSEKTTTFNVTVADHRRVPSQYTWLYEAKDGVLLSTKTAYATFATSGSGGTETLSGSDLVLDCPNTGTASGSNIVRYNLVDTTTTNAKLSCRAKLVHPENGTGATASAGFRLQLSNGTSGAQAFFGYDGDTLLVCYFEGGTKNKVTTSFSVSDYHVFELEFSSGHQIFSIDGVQIFDSTTLSTNYCTANVIFNQAVKAEQCPNGVTTNIDWIAYYEVA